MQGLVFEQTALNGYDKLIRQLDLRFSAENIAFLSGSNLTKDKEQ